MPDLTLGRDPLSMSVHLVAGDPFRCIVQTADGSSWAEAPALDFGGGDRWLAATDGGTATFDVPATTVALRRDNDHVALKVGGVTIARGRVTIL